MDIVDIKWIRNVVLLRDIRIFEVDLFKIFSLVLVVNVFIAYDWVRYFIDNFQQLSDFGVGFIESSIQSSQTKIPQNLQTSDQFPSALQIETEAVFRLLVIEGRNSLVPTLQGCIASQKIVVE